MAASATPSLKKCSAYKCTQCRCSASWMKRAGWVARRCHVDDLAQHKLVRCVQDCDRVYSHCGHPCPKRCHEPCGQCQRIIKEPITLACGHQISGFKCWRRPASSFYFDPFWGISSKCRGSSLQTRQAQAAPI
eukprot:scaffold106349_cov19-Tisochrysis_lutea.AAC.1